MAGGTTEPDARLGTLPGVRRCWTGTMQDQAESTPDDASGANVIARAAALIQELFVTGELIGLGIPTWVSSRGPGATWLVASRGNRVMAIDADPARPVTAIETALVGAEWPAPPAPRRHDATSVQRELARLRQALAAGDATTTGAVIRQLRELPSSPDDPHDHETAPQAVQALLSGIAESLAGNIAVALPSLAVAGGPEHGPSLRWAAQLWGARAALQQIDGAELAARYAEAASRTARELDAEARALAALTRAEVMSAMAEHERAIELARSARTMIGSASDQLFSESWLIEGRCLVALGDLGHAMHVASLVHQLRPTRMTARLLLRVTLETAGLDDAERILAPDLGHAFLADVARERRLLREVRTGALPSQHLVEILELGELPPSGSVLERLRELAAAFPVNDDLQDLLGWKLLRGGAYALARPVFEALALRPLPEDVRTSVRDAMRLLAVAPCEGERTPHRNVQRRAAPTRSPEPGAPPVPVSVFSGTLQTFHLPDLLEFLRNGRKTGTLVCSSAHGTGAVSLRGGKISGATAPASLPLVDVLVSHRVLSEEQARLADRASDGDAQRRLASKLVRDGQATTAQIRAALEARIFEAVAELLNWTEGEFSFDPTPPRATGEPDPFTVLVDPQAVLLEIFAGLDRFAAEEPTAPGGRPS